MNNILQQYIFTCFPLEILYMLSQVNKQLRRQLMKYYSKVRISNFKEILSCLYIRKMRYNFKLLKPIFNDNNFNFIDYDYMKLREYFYTHPSYSSVFKFLNKSIFHSFIDKVFYTRSLFAFLCKYKKHKLINLIIQQMKNKTYTEEQYKIYINRFYERFNLKLLYSNFPTEESIPLINIIEVKRD